MQPPKHVSVIPAPTAKDDDDEIMVAKQWVKWDGEGAKEKHENDGKGQFRCPMAVHRETSGDSGTWYTNCTPGQTWPSIQRLIEHLKRCHSLTFWCSSCKHYFGNTLSKKQVKIFRDQHQADSKCRGNDSHLSEDDAKAISVTLMTPSQHHRFPNYKKEVITVEAEQEGHHNSPLRNFRKITQALFPTDKTGKESAPAENQQKRDEVAVSTTEGPHPENHDEASSSHGVVPVNRLDPVLPPLQSPGPGTMSSYSPDATTSQRYWMTRHTAQQEQLFADSTRGPLSAPGLTDTTETTAVEETTAPEPRDDDWAPQGLERLDAGFTELWGSKGYYDQYAMANDPELKDGEEGGDWTNDSLFELLE